MAAETARQLTKKSIDLNSNLNKWFKLHWFKSANPGHKAHETALTSVSLDISQTPALHSETTNTGLVCCCLLPSFGWCSLHLPTEKSQAKLTRKAGYIPRWFTHPQMVTHPSTSRARYEVTSLIKTKALPVSQRATETTTGKIMFG